MIRNASETDIRNGVPARSPYVRTDVRTDGNPLPVQALAPRTVHLLAEPKLTTAGGY